MSEVRQKAQPMERPDDTDQVLFSCGFLQGAFGRTDTRGYLNAMGVPLETLDELQVLLQDLRRSMMSAR